MKSLIKQSWYIHPSFNEGQSLILQGEFYIEQDVWGHNKSLTQRGRIS